MMIPASAGWQPEAAATSGVVPDGLDASAEGGDLVTGGFLLPLIGLGLIMGAAYIMEKANAVGAENEDDVDVEIDDEDDEDDDFDEDEDDLDDDEDGEIE